MAVKETKTADKNPLIGKEQAQLCQIPELPLCDPLQWQFALFLEFGTTQSAYRHALPES